MTTTAIPARISFTPDAADISVEVNGPFTLEAAKVAVAEALAASRHFSDYLPYDFYSDTPGVWTARAEYPPTAPKGK